MKWKQKPDEYALCGCAISDVGIVRANNEDNYLLEKTYNVHSADHSEVCLADCCPVGTWRIAGVFDGIGGGEAGELASLETARIFAATAESLTVDASRAEVELAMRKAFLQANNVIQDLQEKCVILGTTGTVLCTNGREYKVFHLGDSRAYRLRGGELIRLTRDQTLAQLKAEAGFLRTGMPIPEADHHKLTDFIGRDRTRENIRPEESDWLSAEPGDCFLLCTDGLHGSLPDERLRILASQPGPVEQRAAQLMAEAAQSDDNITCIMLQIDK